MSVAEGRGRGGSRLARPYTATAGPRPSALLHFVVQRVQLGLTHPAQVQNDRAGKHARPLCVAWNFNEALAVQDLPRGLHGSALLALPVPLRRRLYRLPAQQGLRLQNFIRTQQAGSLIDGYTGNRLLRRGVV